MEKHPPRLLGFIGVCRILATDGSTTKENKLRKGAQSPTAQASAQQVQEPHATEEAEPQDRPYQHGRLLVQKKTISCRPELLVNRLVSLLVYARCPIKGRLTPVVTDLQLFPGQWTRPKATFVSHPLYAPNPDVKRPRRARGVGRLEDSAADNPSADSVSKGSQKESEDDPGGSPSPAPSPVYNRSRGGPVAKVQRGVRTALADLHLYSHHWEVLARVSYKSPVRGFANAKGESSLFTVNLIDAQATEIRATFFGRAVSLWYPRLHVGRVYTFGGGVLQRANRVHNPLPHEVEIKFDATAQIEEAEDKPSIPLQSGTARTFLRPDPTAGNRHEFRHRKIPWLVRSGARVNDYAGRACLSSTTQMQISSFSGEQNPGEGPSAAVSLVPQGSRRPCGVPSDQLDAERRWWHLEGQRLSTALPSSVDRVHIIGRARELLQGVSDVQAEGAERASFCFDDRRLQMQQVPLRRDSGAEVRGLAVCRCCYAQLMCRAHIQQQTSLNLTWQNATLYRRQYAAQPACRWMLSLKLADFSGTLSCVALGDQGQAVMQVVDTTAEGLSKLEAGGVDTRGRTFANILEQLSFAEFELELIAKCDVYKEDKTVQVHRYAFVTGLGVPRTTRLIARNKGIHLKTDKMQPLCLVKSSGSECTWALRQLMSTTSRGVVGGVQRAFEDVRQPSKQHDSSEGKKSFASPEQVGPFDVSYEGEEEEEKVEEEGAADQVADEAAATTTAPQAKPKPKPRKQPRPSARKAPKSTPTFFTGKAAGLPPPPKEACVGPPPPVDEPATAVGLGAYLVYTDADGGKLTTQWSKTPLTGAGVLAYIRPGKEIGDYKFEKKSAMEVHASDCQASMTSDFPADRIKYYEGWGAFIKQLSSCGGSLVLLPAADVEPPPKVKIILFNKGKLIPLQVGEEITPSSFDSLAILPSNATKLDVPEMSLSDFVTVANAQGVYVSLKK
ncbi:hypothetical protein ACSSS7_002851 [Eimeria intestinalis]